ncbi:hypothetical protein BVY04_05045 [bacterium M21]|nr:hypothetical protein BVY04_05045 [bacterium M21]
MKEFRDDCRFAGKTHIEHLSSPALDAVLKRMDKLERENGELREMVADSLVTPAAETEASTAIPAIAAEVKEAEEADADSAVAEAATTDQVESYELPSISAAAAKLIAEHKISDEVISTIEPTGKDGNLLGKDVNTYLETL